MRLVAGVTMLIACTSCMDTPPEPGPGPGVSTGVGRIDAVTQGAALGEHAPTLRIEKQITAEDLEAEIEAPMVGVLPGFGRFSADARISLSESIPGAPLAELMISGTTETGESLSLARPLAPIQTRALLGEQRVEFDIPGGLDYGEPTKHVTQSVKSVALSVIDGDVVAMRFELGEECGRANGARTDLGSAAELAVRGVLWITCSTPGPDGSRWQAREDPRLQSELCQNLVSMYGLQQLTGK